MSDMKSALALLQLCDSFFPTGMFAHSLGLEGMVRRGRVRSLEDLEQLLLAMLTHAVIPSDGVALLNAHRAVESANVDELIAMDTRLLLMKAAPELRTASRQHGRRLLTETARYTDNETLAHYRARVTNRESPGTGAVALGAVSGALAIEVDLSFAGYLHGYVTGLVSAAIRLLPVSNSECQAMVHRLQPVIAEQFESLAESSWRDMTSFSPELDIVSMDHVHDDIRMFAS
jgi:urease accessory protein